MATRGPSIFAKLVVLLLAISLIPLCLGAWLVLYRGIHSVQQTALANLELLAGATANRLDQLIIDTARTRDILAADEQVVRFCEGNDARRQELLPEVDAMLKRVAAGNPDYASAFIADTQGIGLASSNARNVGQDLRFREYMRVAIAGHPLVSDIVVGKTTGEAGMYFSTPVKSPAGQVVGAMVIKLSAEAVYRICDEICHRAGNDLAAYITDQDGILLAAPNRDQLYHSFGTLSAADLKRIDPEVRYGIPAIPSLHLEHLTRYLGARRPGSSSFVDVNTDETQILGFAPMQQRDWLVWIQEPRRAFDQPLRQIRRQSWAGVAIVAMAAILLAAFAARRFVRPIQLLTSTARKAAGGDWSARAPVISTDELGDLARTFNDMIPQLEDRSKMEQSLELARRIQQHLLPDAAPAVPGLDIAGLNRPADQTGGDYFDFLDLSPWKPATLAVAIGDVTGHGIPAALLMATARGLLRARATPPGDLAELIGDVNHRLYHDTTEGRFMTLLYAIIERPERRIRLVSAGHDPILMLDVQTGRMSELGGEDLPIAIEESWTFRERVFDHLPERAILLFGTDGIWETRNPAGEIFGKERLQQILRECANCPAAELTQRILAAVDQFRGPQTQTDDVTLVVVRFV